MNLYGQTEGAWHVSSVLTFSLEITSNKLFEEHNLH